MKKKKLIILTIAIPLVIIGGYYLIKSAMINLSDDYVSNAHKKPWKELLADLDKAIWLNPKNYEAYYEKFYEFEHSDSIMAINVLNDLVNAFPDIDDTTYLPLKYKHCRYNPNTLRGNYYKLKMKDYKRAIKDYNIVDKTKINSTKATNYLNRGYCYAMIGDYTNAFYDVCIGIGIAKNNSDEKTNFDLNLLKSCILCKKGSYKEALDVCETPDFKDKILNAYKELTKGSIFYLMGKRTDAINQYQKAYRLGYSSDFTNNYYGILGIDKECAAIALVNLKRYDEAFELDPLNADALIQKALVEYARKNYNEAIDYLTRAIDMRPGLDSLYCKRGVARYALNDYIGAAEDFGKSIGVDDNNIETLEAKATSFNNSNLNYFMAIYYWDELITKVPNVGLYYYNRGLSKLNYKTTGYCEDLEKALTLGYTEASEKLQKYNCR